MAQHTIQALQLPVESFEANLDFYGQLFGWSFAAVPELPIKHTQSSNLPFMFSLMHDMHKPGDVMIVISTDDIDRDLAQVEVLGGTIIQPKVTTPAGQNIAMITDPSGVTLILTEGDISLDSDDEKQ